MEVSSPNSPLVELCHRRWAIPILALCASAPGSGAKFITFAATLGLSRQTLSHTLDALIEQSWLARATGARHPLRPEYVLTRPGLVIAPACRAVLKELRRTGSEELGLRKWSLPLIAVLAPRPRRAARFNELLGSLPEATPRVIAAALRELADAGLVTRGVLDTYPPAAEYRLAPRTGRLAAAVVRLTSELALHPTTSSRPRRLEDEGFRLKKSA